MITSLWLSAIVLVVIGLGYRWFHLASVVAILVVLMLLTNFASPAVLWTGVCVTVVAIGCRWWKVSTGYFCVMAVVAAYLPYAVAAPWIIAHDREMRELRTRYPEQSLAARLAYEPKAMQALPRPAPAPERIERKREWDEQINYTVAARSYSRRERSLSSLLATHADFVADFVNADGFGVVRTRDLPPRKKYIELPEPIAIPVVPETTEESATAEEPTGKPPVSVGVADGEITQFHVDGVIDFLNPEGFGAVDNVSRVIGFQAHGFRKRPELPQRNGTVWRFEELQLVSLLKHEAPAVYLSENLPRMDELREAPTRPLNEFEESALEELRSDEELIVREKPNELRMLGALRAMETCTRCHQVPERTLLGAFSYRLRRQGTREPKSTL